MEYTYYGRMDGKEPKTGVHYMMIEEIVQKILDNGKDKFKSELHDFMRAYKKEIKQEVIKIKNEVKLLKNEIVITKNLIKKSSKSKDKDV